MKHAQRVGSAWMTPTAGKPDRYHYGARLDTGSMIPGIRVRIVEAAKKSEDGPDLVILHTPLDAGEESRDVQIGALWRYEDYFMGRLTPGRLGVVRCPGGAVVDFRLVAEEIGVKLCALKERTEKGPTHILLRLVPKPKDADSKKESHSSPVPAPDVVEFEERQEEEPEEEVPF